MDIPNRIKNMINEVPPLAEGDADMTYRDGRRRLRIRRVVALGGTAAVAVIAIALAVVLPDSQTQPPTVADTPGNGDVQIPEGWETITAGEIALSVPPDWEISRPFEDVDVTDTPENETWGICSNILYGTPASGYTPRPAPVAVVYDQPAATLCEMIGFDGPPEQPGIVLFETLLGPVDGVEDQPGFERIDIEEHAERDQIGALEVWRTIDDEPVSDLAPSGITTYVPVELRGGLWVAHPDDATVQRVLATARPAE